MICLAICKQTNKPAIFHLTSFRKQSIWCTEIEYEFEILYTTNNRAAQSTTWLKLCYWNEKRYKTVRGPLWNNACYKQKSKESEISSFALLWFRVSSNIKTGERGLWSKWRKRETPCLRFCIFQHKTATGLFCSEQRWHRATEFGISFFFSFFGKSNVNRMMKRMEESEMRVKMERRQKGLSNRNGSLLWNIGTTQRWFWVLSWERGPVLVSSERPESNHHSCDMLRRFFVLVAVRFEWMRKQQKSPCWCPCGIGLAVQLATVGC